MITEFATIMCQMLGYHHSNEEIFRARPLDANFFLVVFLADFLLLVFKQSLLYPPVKSRSQHLYPTDHSSPLSGSDSLPARRVVVSGMVDKGNLLGWVDEIGFREKNDHGGKVPRGNKRNAGKDGGGGQILRFERVSVRVI